MEVCRGHPVFRLSRHPDGGAVLRRRGLPRPQGRAGVRGGDPDRHHRRGPHQRPQEERRTRPERHHPVHRRLLRRRRGGRHLHPPGHLHPRGGGQFLADVPQLPAGRRAGHPVPDSFPQVFREGDARQVSVPGGHGDDAGPRERRKRRLLGEDARVGRPHRRSVRLPRRHLRHLGGNPVHHRDGLGPGRGRQGQGGAEDQHRRGRAGPRLHRGPQVRLHHLLRLPARVAAA